MHYNNTIIGGLEVECLAEGMRMIFICMVVSRVVKQKQDLEWIVKWKSKHVMHDHNAGIHSLHNKRLTERMGMIFICF